MPSGRGRKSTHPESTRRESHHRLVEVLPQERHLRDEQAVIIEDDFQEGSRRSNDPRSIPLPDPQPYPGSIARSNIESNATAYPYTVRDDGRRQRSSTYDVPARRNTNEHSPPLRPVRERHADSMEQKPAVYHSSQRDTDEHSPPPYRVQQRRTDSAEQGFPPSERDQTINISSALARPRLSNLAQGFVNIQYDDFVECIRYVRDHPDILMEDLQDLTVEAKELFRKGEARTAMRCIQRLLMLRHCQQNGLLDVRSSAEHFKELHERPNVRAGLRKKTDVVAAAMKQDLHTMSNPQSGSRAHSSTQHLSIQSYPRTEHLGERTTDTVAIRQVPHPEDASSYQPPAMIPHSPHPRTYSQSRRLSVTGPPARLSDTRLITVGGHDNHSSAYGTETTLPFHPGQGNPNQASQGYSTNNALLEMHGDDPSLVDRSKIDMQESTTVSITGFDVRRNDGKAFFSVGRIFKLIWYQPAGSNLRGDLNLASGRTQELGDSNVFYKEMWMLVAVRRNGYSLCCPISTYKGQGVLKTGLPRSEVRAHAIIYSDGYEIREYEGEKDLLGKDPIPVVMKEGRGPPLNPASRVHFGKFHTVEWNVPVKEIGRVHPDYRDMVRDYFMKELGGNSVQNPPQSRTNAPPTPSTMQPHERQDPSRGRRGAYNR